MDSLCLDVKPKC